MLLRTSASIECFATEELSMPQFSSEILDTYLAPALSDLTVCGAKELPAPPDYLLPAIWGHIAGVRYKKSALLHLSLTFLKRSIVATDEYRMARENLLQYVDGLSQQQHRLASFLSALSHFEQCIGAVWQAAELYDETERWLLNSGQRRPNLFKRGDGSDLERLNQLNNVIKHFAPCQAAITSAPVWITNTGLRSAGAVVSFDELLENIQALWEVNRVTFVEIPNEISSRDQAPGGGVTPGP